MATAGEWHRPPPHQTQRKVLRLPRIGYAERPPARQRVNGLFLWLTVFAWVLTFRPERYLFLLSTGLTLALTYATSSPCALAMARHRFRAPSRYWRRNPHVMYSAAPRVPANRKGTRYRAVNASTL